MSNSISGGISFSGIGSGTDFSAMLEQLKEVESFRLYSLQDSREDASEVYEAYQDLLSTLSEAQESLSLLDSYEEFLTKIASSSSEATLGVKADANAVDGTHKIEVTQLASNAIWANKGSYAEKTTVINSSGTAQDFSYTYMGTTRTLSVPAGTTLEGFANMVNQDTGNPGVRVSLLKTGSGYSFQISGDKSGAEATLDIHPSSLTGLSGSGGTWESSAAVDLDEVFNAGQTPNSYTYKITMNNGNVITTAPLSGDATQREIYQAINTASSATSWGNIASLDEATGVMTIAGMHKMETTITPHGGGASTTTSVQSLPKTSFTLQGNLTDRTLAAADYVFTNSDGDDFTISMSGGHTQQDILNKLKEEGYTSSSRVNGNVTEVEIEGLAAGGAAALVATDYSTLGSVTNTTFTISSAELDTMRGVGTTIYTFKDTANNDVSIEMTGSHSVSDVLDKLHDKGYSVSGKPSGDNMDITVEGLSDMNVLTSTLTTATDISQSATINLGSDITAENLAATSYSFTKADGSSAYVTLGANHSQQDILDALDAQGLIVTQSTVNGRTQVTIDGLKNADALLATDTTRVTPTVTTVEQNYKQTINPDDPLQIGLVPEDMSFEFKMQDGSTRTVAVTGGQTMRQALTGAGFAASAFSVDPDTNKLSIDGVVSITGIPGAVGITGSLSGSDAWEVQASQDAIFKVDNWPQDLTSSTNEVTEVLEGITLSLRDVGTAHITVAADTDSVRANIQTVLDSFNSVLKKVQDLTAITEGVTTYDDEGNETMATTQGSALTGEYSVQLFTSRFKAAVAENPPGFQPMTADDIFSGDFISSLAQMGIKVSADKDSADFGLFAIAPHGTTDAMQALDQATFDKAIQDNLEEVISFFANSGVGRSSSPNFRYAQHVDGVTQPGTYDVTYNVGLDGTITDVFINGILAAASESTPNTFTVGSDGGDAAGMSITVDNLSAGSYTGSVSVQQGKVGQIVDFFADELRYIDPEVGGGDLSTDNGGLKIAEASSLALIEQLDTRIAEEQTRLTSWEERERLKFARLDTLLGDYNSKMDLLTQQLAQLG